MENLILYWLAAAVLLLFFELANPSHFLFLSFSLGTLGGALASWLGLPFVSQAIVALFGTASAFVFLRYWIEKQTKHISTKEHRSNVDALEGKTGIIIKEVRPQKFGQVKIGGQVWSCRSAHDECIVVNQEVRIVGVKGAHVIVKQLDER